MKVKTTSTTDSVKCRFCVEGQNFRRMVARQDGRFVCGRCGHVEIPHVKFECNCGKCAEHRKYNPEVVSFHCEIIADATGYPCDKYTSARCSVCSKPICDAHSESCAACGGVFCAWCLAFHNREQPERQRRKSA